MRRLPSHWIVKGPREICPICGQAGSGIYWKSMRSRGRVYRYAYFAHHLSRKRLKWCYLGREGFARSDVARKSSIDRHLSALLDSYVVHLRRRFQDGLVAVALFGSAARGEAVFPSSDIDVLVVVRGFEGRSLAERIRLLSEVEGDLSEGEEYRGFVSAYGVPLLQPHVLTPSEVSRHPPLLLDVVTDGVVFYDDGFLVGELGRMEARLRELGAEKRRLSDGSWYWRLKRDLKWGEVVEL
jgi:predicted nucleotidyltransferase